MTRDGFSAGWTFSHAGRMAPLLALAIASGCGARPASPAATAAAAGAGAQLDEAGCLALVVDEPAARSRCEGNARGPCVSEIELEPIHTSPALYVCWVLTTQEHWEEAESEEEIHVATDGTYTLAVIERVEGAWVVRGEEEYRHWLQEIEGEKASMTVETIGPDKKAVVVNKARATGAYTDTDVTFHLVTSHGLTEIFSFSSKVEDEGREERSYHIDDQATTAGHHDIVLSVEEESYVAPDADDDEDDDGGGDNGAGSGVKSWEERYRWDGKEYEQVESTDSAGD